MIFILFWKLFLVSRYVNFRLALLVMKKKRDEKDKVNFKIYDVTAWLTNNHNKRTAQYFLKLRQPGNETWSGNRI